MILDTDAVSALFVGDRNLARVLATSPRHHLPVIVLGEYRYGISLSREQRQYEKRLAEYLPKFQVLDVDEQTTLPYSAIRTELKTAGTPIPSNDCWIAALCRQHSVPITSRDRRFDLVSGIQRLGW